MTQFVPIQHIQALNPEPHISGGLTAKFKWRTASGDSEALQNRTMSSAERLSLIENPGKAPTVLGKTCFGSERFTQ